MYERIVLEAEASKTALLCDPVDYFFISTAQLHIEGVTFEVAG